MNTLKQVYEYFFAFTINFVFIILGVFFVCMGGGEFKKTLTLASCFKKN